MMKIHDSKTFDKTKFNAWKSDIRASQASKSQTVINTTHNNTDAYHANNHNNVAEYTTYTYTPHTNTTTMARPESFMYVGEDAHIDFANNKDEILRAKVYSKNYSQYREHVNTPYNKYGKHTYTKNIIPTYNRYGESDHGNYSKYSQHTDQAETTTPTVHPHVNTGHSNNVPHSNYGFSHNNTVPCTPDVYDINNGDRFKNTVTIGYFSYDKENDPVYYDISYRQTQNLDGTSNINGWTLISSNTVDNTVSINTIGIPEGIYEFQIKAYNAPRNENGVSKTYESGIKTFTVKIKQNKAPVIQNIKNVALVSTDINDKWDNNKPVNFSYKVYDYNADPITTKHYIDGDLITTVNNNSGSIVNFEIPSIKWDSLTNGEHVIKIEVTDNIDDGEHFSKTITKLDDRLLFVTNPYQTPKLATKANITLLHKKETDDTLQVWICNNAYDENPAWEDCTNAYYKSIAYIFKNDTKVNDKAGISMKVLLKKSFAKE